MTSLIAAIAWTLALVDVWAYGQSVRLGGLIGVACATCFILLALATCDVFMGLANVGFFGLHCVNLWISRPCPPK